MPNSAVGEAGAEAGHLQRRRAALRGHLAMLIFSALVAGSFSFGALVARDIAPVTLMTLRFVLGAVMIAAIFAATGRLRALRLARPARFLLLGGIFAAYFLTMFEALRVAGPVPLAAIFTLTPLMTALTARAILGQRTGALNWLALAIGAAGALWVIFRADLSALLALRLGWGEKLFIFGAFLHALYVPLLRRFNQGEGPLASTFGVLVGGALVLLAWGWDDIRATDWAGLPLRVWLVLAYLMVFATVTTFSLVQYGAMRLPASKVMAYTYLTPSFVIGWEVALGHGVPPVAVLAGVGLTLVALMILLGRDERPPQLSG